MSICREIYRNDVEIFHHVLTTHKEAMERTDVCFSKSGAIIEKLTVLHTCMYVM